MAVPDDASSTALLEARGLTVTAPDSGATLLRDLDFRLSAGDRILLTGPSGSGKTTLLRALVALEPSRGELRLEGRTVTPERVRELRRRVAYLPQTPVAIAPTVAENLDFAAALGNGTGDDADRAALLDRLDLLDLDLSRRFDGLSGGERQRATVVRSLLARPDVLLLDEPTASLDEGNVAGVVALIDEWVRARAGRAFVWVSHHGRELGDLPSRTLDITELQP